MKQIFFSILKIIAKETSQNLESVLRTEHFYWNTCLSCSQEVRFNTNIVHSYSKFESSFKRSWDDVLKMRSYLTFNDLILFCFLRVSDKRKRAATVCPSTTGTRTPSSRTTKGFRSRTKKDFLRRTKCIRTKIRSRNRREKQLWVASNKLNLNLLLFLNELGTNLKQNIKYSFLRLVLKFYTSI